MVRASGGRIASAGMKFGLIMLPRDLEETRAVARNAEAAGLAWLGIADSPTVYQDSFLHQAEAAHATTRLRIGPAATHFTVRHPVVVANALATLGELSGGRVTAILATGNSAARGFGVKPTKLAVLAEGVAAMRGYWAGEGAEFGPTRIPATERERQGCPLLIAADGPKTAALAGEVGDGILYSGTMDREVRRRRLAAGRPRQAQEAWLAPSASLAESQEEVREDLGALLVAMTNRAMRGDLDERGVPAELQEEIRGIWRGYDYGVHADSSKPRNATLLSDALTDYLIDRLCVWGSAQRWRQQITELDGDGWDGLALILDRGRAVPDSEAIIGRLAGLGLLPAVGLGPRED